MPHLPFALGDDDEFLHPSQGWLLRSRTIVFDSWLCWRQALPDPNQRHVLPRDVSIAIAVLAHALDDIHRTLPGYEELGDTPFSIPRWWDPEDGDGWQTGCLLLFRLEGTRPDDFLAAWRQRFRRLSASPVRLRAVSARYMEATLLKVPAVLPPWIESGSQPPVSRLARQRRRTPQTPPPRTDETHCGGPRPEPR